ncbi:beta-ketoacyl synthase N-terminal-like domain-containing protein [Burkholderia thailandensis]|uniref:Polyketide beta-ketoacyl synthase, putative n=2 Tax=Burkholderia thailandensis TaxID=57975 RepID=Q2T4N4_BURTA|nr:beta-ketoacyl synthase N-terminal-like domain-containing protein [Burkholderia thailandensis]ABC34518.1 polyketide beta-ketoacyl synthase, putative [Burkholderia thailandensis E264]AHI75315.1 polyketide biosynthesis malonyl-ACP decarboxylase PksF [Burkholderia thailandensis 2002721723]AHI81444.1 polyketide biosynthesis malonyl-ACP decarboxylase PksF [Burkholderia thailandensis E444]AIC89289.1 polyketide biosynthesis malonyl-ACP decarboxylase PksF [Burkholderia thailandensis USAMRU Malaysia \
MARAVVTGLGVVSPIGIGVPAFEAALFAGGAAFGVMRREGRQHAASAFLGAELPAFELPASAFAGAQRLSLPARAALAALGEAWADAALRELDPARVGLVIGGSNLQQRELARVHEAFRERPLYVRPNHAVSYMDTDLAGACAQAFGVRGAACTVGGASASGLLAVVEAARLVQAGELDACVAVGGLADLSHLECQAFRSLGAMGSERFADDPGAACRPFDRARDGFIYGEACAALVVESPESAGRRGARARAALAGWSVVSGANRGPNATLDAEADAIGRALAHAGWRAADVDYVNPHGSGSVSGDEIELAALAAAGLGHAWLNATKSLTGHALSAAGAVETLATVLQMQASRLHPTRNLDDPIAPARWVRGAPQPARVGRALKLSYGFGGINAALCLEHVSQRIPREEVSHAGRY